MADPQPPPKTEWGRKTEEVLENIFEPLDLIGRRLLGSSWRLLYESILDAIVFSFLLIIPSIIGRFILGKDFSSYDVCWKENPLGATYYACYAIVTSDILLWIGIIARIFRRFLGGFISFRSRRRRIKRQRRY